jgi:lipopolysaccharide/colanic/teichoic acid biosynthesis glycosyltransferase
MNNAFATPRITDTSPWNSALPAPVGSTLRQIWRRRIVSNLAVPSRRVAAAGTVDLAAKRAIDIVIAGTASLVLLPVFALVAAAVRLTSPGAAILRQIRIGKDGKPFTLYKFRSMYHESAARQAQLAQQNQHGADGVTFKLKRDPRITSLGYWLRRASIDELPQLWNVLKGDMSLVGPRPPLPHEVVRYTPAQARRLAARPGLTCLWQVSGRADLPFARQVELDIEYLTSRSILTDLRILLLTIPAVLTARGAY